jgi:hypothetical protein
MERLLPAIADAAGPLSPPDADPSSGAELEIDRAVPAQPAPDVRQEIGDDVGGTAVLGGQSRKRPAQGGERHRDLLALLPFGGDVVVDRCRSGASSRSQRS